MTNSWKGESLTQTDLDAEIIDAFLERLHRGETPNIDDYISEGDSSRDHLGPVLRTLELLHRPSNSHRQKTLGDFRIVREIGRGAMGIVYEGHQVSLNRKVALKLLPQSVMASPRSIQRFQHEAMAGAQIEHPNIIHVYNVDCVDGVHFFAMQFVDGITFAELGRRWQGEKPVKPNDGGDQLLRSTIIDLSTLSPTSRDRRTQVTEHIALVAEAIEHVHQLGIVHRDIKPSNLMLDHQGTVWVTDFGLAHFVNTPAESRELAGTPRYMSPEQIDQPASVDPRTDVYSLGVTFYELLSLQPAFSGKSWTELSHEILNKDPIPLRRIDPAIPYELEVITSKAIAKDPRERYQSAGEFAADLRRFLNHRPVTARRPTVSIRLKKFAKRNQTTVLSTMTVTIAILLVAAMLLFRSNQDLQNALQRETTAKTNAHIAKGQAIGNLRIATEILDSIHESLVEKQFQSSLEEIDTDLLEELDRFYQRLSRFNDLNSELTESLATARVRLSKIYLLIGEFERAYYLASNAAGTLEQLIKVSPKTRHYREQLVSTLTIMANAAPSNRDSGNRVALHEHAIRELKTLKAMSARDISQETLIGGYTLRFANNGTSESEQWQIDWPFAAGSVKIREARLTALLCNDYMRIWSMTGSGSRVIVAGQYKGTLDSGSSTHTSKDHASFLTGYSKSGRVLWTREFPSPQESRIYSVAANEHQIIIAGLFHKRIQVGKFDLEGNETANVFVAALTTSGEPMWAKAITSPKDTNRSLRVVVSSDGHATLRMGFQEKLDCGTSELRSTNDARVAACLRFDRTGQLVFALQGQGGSLSLEAMPNGDVIVGGGFGTNAEYGEVTRLSTTGAVRWRVLCPGSSGIAATADDLVIVGRFKNTIQFQHQEGKTILTSVGETDGYIASFDSNSGECRWAKSFGGKAKDGARDVAIDRMGSTWVCGYFGKSARFENQTFYGGGTSDALILKLAANGKLIRSICFGGPEANDARNIVTNPGRVIVSGYFDQRPAERRIRGYNYQISSQLNSIGLLYKATRQYSEALQYFNRALELAENLVDDAQGSAPYLHLTGGICHNIALVKLAEGVTDAAYDEVRRAVEFQNRALAFDSENRSYLTFQRNHWYLLARLALMRAKKTRALHWAEKSLTISRNQFRQRPWAIDERKRLIADLLQVVILQAWMHEEASQESLNILQELHTLSSLPGWTRSSSMRWAAANAINGDLDLARLAYQQATRYETPHVGFEMTLAQLLGIVETTEDIEPNPEPPDKLDKLIDQILRDRMKQPAS